MLKSQELTSSTSCLAKAYQDEMLFILLARDPAAPKAIRYWVGTRIEDGKNGPGDPQILEAVECARVMDSTGEQIRRRLVFVEVNSIISRLESCSKIFPGEKIYPDTVALIKKMADVG